MGWVATPAKSKSIVKELTMRILNTLIFITILSFMLGSQSWAQERRGKEYLDCSRSELKKAELKYQEAAKPLLATYAEQYSGRMEVLKEKEQKRARLFREWLNVRCTCMPAGISNFEKTLCRALTEDLPVSGRDVCLVQN
jgi:hypothetical protein